MDTRKTPTERLWRWYSGSRRVTIANCFLGALLMQTLSLYTPIMIISNIDVLHRVFCESEESRTTRLCIMLAYILFLIPFSVFFVCLTAIAVLFTVLDCALETFLAIGVTVLSAGSVMSFSYRASYETFIYATEKLLGPLWHNSCITIRCLPTPCQCIHKQCKRDICFRTKNLGFGRVLFIECSCFRRHVDKCVEMAGDSDLFNTCFDQGQVVAELCLPFAPSAINTITTKKCGHFDIDLLERTYDKHVYMWTSVRLETVPDLLEELAIEPGNKNSTSPSISSSLSESSSASSSVTGNEHRQSNGSPSPQNSNGTGNEIRQNISKCPRPDATFSIERKKANLDEHIKLNVPLEAWELGNFQMLTYAYLRDAFINGQGEELVLPHILIMKALSILLLTVLESVRIVQTENDVPMLLRSFFIIIVVGSVVQGFPHTRHIDGLGGEDTEVWKMLSKMCSSVGGRPELFHGGSSTWHRHPSFGNKQLCGLTFIENALYNRSIVVEDESAENIRRRVLCFSRVGTAVRDARAVVDEESPRVQRWGVWCDRLKIDQWGIIPNKKWGVIYRQMPKRLLLDDVQ